MEDLMIYLPFLIPLGLLQITLAVVAAIHVVRHPHYRFGNMVIWLVVVLLCSLIGPVVYFALGRGEE